MTYTAMRINEFCWLSWKDVIRDEVGDPVAGWTFAGRSARSLIDPGVRSTGLAGV